MYMNMYIKNVHCMRKKRSYPMRVPRGNHYETLLQEQLATHRVASKIIF